MPIKRCTLPEGGKGWQWGNHGKCYASRTDAEKQAAAAHANGFVEKSNLCALLGKVETVNKKANLAALLKGDVVGHEFHGNQYTGGVGGGGSDEEVALPNTDAQVDEFIDKAKNTKAYKETLYKLEQLEKETDSGKLTHWSKEQFTDENGKYTAEREAKHEEIINKALTEDTKAAEGTRPTAVLLIGQPGAGKTTASNTVLPDIISTKLAVINADDVKAALPEYKGWNAAALHEESSDVAEGKLLPRAIEGNHNMLLDITGTNSAKMEKIASALGSKGYDVHVINVTTEPHVSLGRVYGRFLGKEKRFVPLDYAKSIDHLPDKTYEKLKDNSAVKTWHKFDNSGKTAKLIDKGSK